jgi:2',3'-cyclic-nucleotide 2'-phosphodiesterase (5'-nucleotidase family)
VIVKKWNDLEGTPIDLEKIYSVSSTEYITHGKDGYDEFLNMKIIRDEHSSFDVTTMIYKTFKELQVGSEYVSSPFVKVKSSLLLGKGLIVSSVRR